MKQENQDRLFITLSDEKGESAQYEITAAFSIEDRDYMALEDRDLKSGAVYLVRFEEMEDGTLSVEALEGEEQEEAEAVFKRFYDIEI